jgi:uncharacterized membrane protein
MLASVRLFTRIAVWFCSAGFSALTAIEALSRYAAYHNRTYDLAIYAREAWGLARGDFWDPILDVHFLGTHVALVLWPLGWLGRWFGTVPVLLFAQALAFGLATLPLAQLGARRFGDAGALVATAAWLLYPNLGHVASYEFHPGSLAVLPLALALDAFDRGSRRGVLLYGACMLLCRADMAILVALLGAVACSSERMRPAGYALIGIGLGYLAVIVLWFSRYWAPEGSLALHFGAWGGSPLGIVTALFSEPARVLEHFSDPRRATYLLRVLFPLCFLPLLGPRFLVLCAPALAQNLISTFPTTIELYSHYLTIAVPPLVVAALDGARVLSRHLRPWRSARLPMVAMAGAALAASVQAGGMPWSRDYDRAAFTRDAFSDEAARTVALIPRDVSVQAPDALLPHLVERSRVFRGPPPDRRADYVVLDVSHRVRFAHDEDLLRTVEEPSARTWLGRRDYGLVYAEPTLLTLRRGSDPRQGPVERYFPREAGDRRAVKLTGCLLATSAWLAPDGLELELFAASPCPNDLAIRIGSSPSTTRVDLLFDGLLSPAHLRDEYLLSFHPLTDEERAALIAHGLYLGALRSSGAPPDPGDPKTVKVPLLH